MTAFRSWIVLGLTLAALPGSARAAVYLQQSGEDSSPYAFTPALARGTRNTAYAFTNALDGVDHSFEYYLRFDLPELSPGEEVVEAWAWVYYGYDYTIFGDTTGELGAIDCRQVQGAWSELTLTWNNRPAVGPVFDGWQSVDSFGMYWCDVTGLVQDWISGAAPNHGIAITSDALRVIGFYSFDDGTVGPNFKPSLVIQTVSDTDPDGDGVPGDVDNCADLSNPLQEDGDGDGVGDACDVCPSVSDPEQMDSDGDGIGDRCDSDVADANGDGVVAPGDPAAFRESLGATSGSAGSQLAAPAQAGAPVYRADRDLDLDGDIDAADYHTWIGIYLRFDPNAPACGLLGIEPFALLGAVPVLRRLRPRGAASARRPIA